MPFIVKVHRKQRLFFILLWVLILPASAAVISENSRLAELSDSLVQIRTIRIQGNGVTHPSIIFRELLFREGDSFSPAGLEQRCNQSEQNLLNTSLFNFVTIQPEVSGNLADVSITITERWYIWPSPIFELADRNFNTWWKSRDFSRVNYGFRLKWSNFRGRMENLDLMARFGKNEHFSLLYTVPYVNKNRKAGAGIETGMISKREVGYATMNNELRYLYDHNRLFTQLYAGLIYTYRGGIHVTHTASLRWQYLSFSDTLQKANPGYYPADIATSAFLSFYYKFKADYRDARYYPLKGWYFDFELLKSGFGLGFEKGINAFWAKSTSRVFVPLTSRISYGGSVTGKISPGGDHSYYFNQGMGYERDYVRGYEYYVVDASHYLLTRNTVRYAVIPQRTYNAGFIPSPKFSKVHYAVYLTLFGDAGYTWLNVAPSAGNTLPETLLAGAGAGIDFVTYYDKVVRIEYSFNKSGESGIFIHFIAGI